MDKQQVLAGNIDGKIVDYVEEVMRVHNLEMTAKDNEIISRITAINDHIQILSEQITELQGQLTASTSDDKYALTKAKLIRLMKDMGYYK